MDINIEETKTLWETILQWLRGNNQLVKAGEYTLYKKNVSPTNIPERGDVLTGFFTDPKTGEKVFGNAVYLGENNAPNYKLLNTLKPEL